MVCPGKVKSELDSRVLEQQQRLKELETALEKSGAETDRLATAQRQQAKEVRGGHVSHHWQAGRQAGRGREG